MKNRNAVIEKCKQNANRLINKNQDEMANKIFLKMKNLHFEKNERGFISSILNGNDTV